MYKLGIEEAEKPEIKFSTSSDHRKAREFQKNIYYCFIDYAKAFDSVDHKNCGKLLKR